MKILVQLVLAISLLPYLLLNFRAFGFFGGLGANPIEAIIHDTGLWGIRFLIITLLLTPIYHYSKQEIFRRLPKPIGLIAFFYVLNHLFHNFHIYTFGGLKETNTWLTEKKYA